MSLVIELKSNFDIKFLESSLKILTCCMPNCFFLVYVFSLGWKNNRANPFQIMLFKKYYIVEKKKNP